MYNYSFFSVNLPQKIKVGLFFLGLICFVNISVQAQFDGKSMYGQQALQESIIPVRPGIPGEISFWNEFSRQFIFAPAFNYKIVDKSDKYLYEIVSLTDSSKYNFESRVPYAPLSMVWTSIPVGGFTLKVTGISSTGQILGVAGEGKYYRAAYFNGIYHQPVMPYDKSAMIALDKLLKKDFVNYWFTHKAPDPGYEYYRYPAKIMGALVIGAVTQARLKSNTPDAKRYTELACIIADYLISVSFEKGTPLEYFPPTYRGYEAIFKEVTPYINTNNDLIISAADGGNAYLDLYDLTSDKKYLDAAERIARTYVKTQLDNGSWYMFIDVNTGKPALPNIAIPTSTINYFDRLSRDYNISDLENATKKALQWIMDNPVKTYDWQGQFEDIVAKPSYKNQSREQVCDMAMYLLKNINGNPQNLQLAEELIRFAEDQFIIWEKPAPKSGNKGQGPAWNPENWITPGVQEQYVFWEPVGRAACIMMETYREAYKVTKKDLYLAKALSIANTFTVVQNEHDGDYPTLFSNYKSNFWLNSVVYPAKMMMVLENNLKELSK